jgi:2-dehydro-3-deoxyphosphogluconate aldolase/(4S)-4-hydroxy-2-oxoglutarate aldolase
MQPEMIEKITQAGVVAVLVIDELAHAVPLANALMAGGVNTIELTLRTPIALDAARAIKQEVPGLSVGLGTVLTVAQVKAAADLGADFAVAPGCNPRILAAAQDHGLSFGPGVATASEIELAIEHGCRLLKFFPAETSGGIKHLKSMAGPYQYLGLSFIPLGGLNINNAASYLESPFTAAIGGSWIAKRPVIKAENWDQIMANAREARELVKRVRG